MALFWPKHGPHMVLHIGSSWFIINVPRDAPCQISQFWVYPIVPFPLKWPKYGPFISKTWSSHGPSNWFFLNHNQFVLRCYMPNVTILGEPHSPFSYKWPKHGPFMAKTWSTHGPSNWFFLNLNQCAQGCSMPNFRVLASILTDILTFWFWLTHQLSHSVTEWDVELRTWPEARDGAKITWCTSVMTLLESFLLDIFLRISGYLFWYCWSWITI